MATTALAQEKVWLDKYSYDKAERLHQEKLAKGSQPSVCSISSAGGSLANEVAKARQHIKQSYSVWMVLQPLLEFLIKTLHLN